MDSGRIFFLQRRVRFAQTLAPEPRGLETHGEEAGPAPVSGRPPALEAVPHARHGGGPDLQRSILDLPALAPCASSTELRRFRTHPLSLSASASRFEGAVPSLRPLLVVAKTPAPSPHEMDFRPKRTLPSSRRDHALRLPRRDLLG